jgi:hypothetical protein
MDASNCKIEQLTLSADSLQFSQDSLLQSNQLQTIRKLVLRHIVDCDLTFLQQIPMLNELCLHFFRHATHNTIYIFDILTDFSSHLESIQIEHYTLACGKIKVLREQSSIRRLKFVNVTFTQGVDDFLSAYAPNTRILILQHCKIDPFTMNLPNFELSYFETDNVLMPHKKSFMVKTLKDNHCQFYSSIGKRSRDNALEKESTSGSYVPHYYTELICYSIRNANIILQ